MWVNIEFTHPKNFRLTWLKSTEIFFADISVTPRYFTESTHYTGLPSKDNGGSLHWYLEQKTMQWDFLSLNSKRNSLRITFSLLYLLYWIKYVSYILNYTLTNQQCGFWCSANLGFLGAIDPNAPSGYAYANKRKYTKTLKEVTDRIRTRKHIKKP